MIKRVNFTGRRRISRKHVEIEVFDGHPRRFDARLILDDLELPNDAAVYIEATCAGSNAVQRFDFGQVGAVEPLSKPELSKIEGENVFFTLKVVDTSHRFGRILAIAENVRPERAGEQTATGRRGILPIEEKDLGQELWKLEFRESGVSMLANSNVPGLVDRICSDPALYSVVYPVIVRNVLGKAIRDGGDLDDDDECWQALWLRFGRNLHPEWLAPPNQEDDVVEIEEWVDEVVEAFCKNHALKDKFLHVINGNGDVDL